MLSGNCSSYEITPSADNNKLDKTNKMNKDLKAMEN